MRKIIQDVLIDNSQKVERTSILTPDRSDLNPTAMSKNKQQRETSRGAVVFHTIYTNRTMAQKCSGHHEWSSRAAIKSSHQEQPSRVAMAINFFCHAQLFFELGLWSHGWPI